MCSKIFLKNIIILPAFLTNRSEPNPSTHGDMGWCWVSHGSYPKVMLRSSQGHSKVKSAENGSNNLFLLFLITLYSLEMYMMA